MEYVLVFVFFYLIGLVITTMVLRWMFRIDEIIANLQKIKIYTEDIRKTNEIMTIKYDRIIKQQEVIIDLNAERNDMQTEIIELFEDNKNDKSANI